MPAKFQVYFTELEEVAFEETEEAPLNMRLLTDHPPAVGDKVVKSGETYLVVERTFFYDFPELEITLVKITIEKQG